jgi:NTE family protein
MMDNVFNVVSDHDNDNKQTILTKNYKDFIKQSGADEVIERLRLKLTDNGTKPMPVYSDMVLEEDGIEYQCVNYVQEGGGVLGVALIGYTYVLEKLGFRFLKMAGTSAGAINTLLLAAVNKENYNDTGLSFQYKSEIILQEMLNFNLWSLVDGSKFGKWLIKLLIAANKKIKLLLLILLSIVIIPLLFSVLAVFGRILFGLWPAVGLIKLYDIFAWISFISLIFLFIALLTALYYIRRFKKAGFGINPGNEFHKWMKKILMKNKIETVSQLNQSLHNSLERVRLRQERQNEHFPGGASSIHPPYITLVTSDITNELKVELPAMAKDYYDEPDLANPADFVRASMSIPVFFEPFTVNVSAKLSKVSTLQKNRITKRRVKKESYKVFFMDGGVLSNFPFSVFHNPAIKIARMPTFGVRLEDEDHEKSTTSNKMSGGSFFELLGKLFNTIRFNFDRDFLKRNSVYEMCIGHVDLEKENWLDFSISYERQVALFKKGVAAAEIFFTGGQYWVDGKPRLFEAFDWQRFKDARQEVVDVK